MNYIGFLIVLHDSADCNMVGQPAAARVSCRNLAVWLTVFMYCY